MAYTLKDDDDDDDDDKLNRSNKSDINIYRLVAFTRVYPKVSGLAAWSENCKWYRPLPLDAVVSLFCKSA
jgi:hypothetical protein